jgi:hypothetical protein
VFSVSCFIFNFLDTNEKFDECSVEVATGGDTVVLEIFY